VSVGATPEGAAVFSAPARPAVSSQDDFLKGIAVGAGLPAERVDAVLAGEEFAADVRADIDQARAYGATGVPFFVVDQKYGVSGAQPTELFAQLLERAWSESQPAVELVGGSADGACGPDGCAI